jgi:ribosomal protein L35
VRNEEILFGVKDERNIIHTIKRMKADWTGDILRRNSLLKHVIEVKIEERRRGRRERKQLLDDVKEMRR